MSPAIQALIDKGVFDRLPPTFSTFFFEQIKEWKLLFPAEQNYFERLFTLIDGLQPAQSEALFAPLRAVEQKMGVNTKTWPRRSFTLEQVDFLNRNPHYGEWRKVVSAIFGELDPILEQEAARRGRPRLAIIAAPAELPISPEQMWTRLKGTRVDLEEPFDPEKHLLSVMAAGSATPYDRWIVQTGATIPAARGAVSLSYDSLAAYRQRLMREVQQVVEKERLRGPRELGERLKKIRLLAGEIADDPILAEFVRSVLLAGNGTLLLNNTFVEWATIQAVRRARPSMIAVGFGIRNKMKPFSSLLIYADQDQANPIPTQMDVLGSAVDLEVFYQYIWQEFEKYVEYRNNTVYLFCAAGADQVCIIAPRDFVVSPRISPVSLTQAVKEWLQL